MPPSALSLNGRRRLHWSAVRKLQAAAGEVAYHAIREANAAENVRIRAKARVQIDLVYPGFRRRDPDGLAGLAKPILDSLVALGVLLDDDSEHVELAVRALVQKRTTETRILVEEIPSSWSPVVPAGVPPPPPRD